jgi:hypothetical protein
MFNATAGFCEFSLRAFSLAPDVAAQILHTWGKVLKFLRNIFFKLFSY